MPGIKPLTRGLESGPSQQKPRIIYTHITATRSGPPAGATTTTSSREDGRLACHPSSHSRNCVPVRSATVISFLHLLSPCLHWLYYRPSVAGAEGENGVGRTVYPLLY